MIASSFVILEFEEENCENFESAKHRTSAEGQREDESGWCGL
jgi:hypothetical protein